MTPLITLRDIHKSYYRGDAAIPVLKGISFDIASGEFVAVMGPSGSGKSTLMNIIGCLDVPERGTYRLAGAAIEDATEEELAHVRNRRLGFVFQLFNLIPRISAVRNVELPLIYAGVPLTERKARAQRMLEHVGLSDRADHSPAQLSGGQQQRVAIARALANQPAVLIADEPTGSLDSRAGDDIMRLFAELNRAGLTIVMVTHEQDIAAHAKRVIRLRDGLVESDEDQ